MLTAVVVPFPITTTTKDVTCQYAAVYVATAKVITADVIVCYLFQIWVVEHWNLLPQEIKNAKTLITFKNRIDNYPKLQEKFLEFDER